MHLLESTITVWTRSIKEVLAASPDADLEVRRAVGEGRVCCCRNSWTLTSPSALPTAVPTDSLPTAVEQALPKSSACFFSLSVRTAEHTTQ